MNVKINGDAKAIEKDALTISELLTHEKVDMPDMVTVEYNGSILDRDQFDTTAVKDGDEIEFLYFMGGGNFA